MTQAGRWVASGSPDSPRKAMKRWPLPYPISDVEHVVESVLVDEATASPLGIDSAAPCLSVIRRTWLGET